MSCASTNWNWVKKFRPPRSEGGGFCLLGGKVVNVHLFQACNELAVWCRSKTQWKLLCYRPHSSSVKNQRFLPASPRGKPRALPRQPPLRPAWGRATSPSRGGLGRSRAARRNGKNVGEGKKQVSQTCRERLVWDTVRICFESKGPFWRG